MSSVGILAIQVINAMNLFDEFDWNNLMWKIVVAKCACMTPFITFEYYLIMFEHLFVDTSHYMSSVSSLNFISIRSPQVKIISSESKLKEESRLESARRLREINQVTPKTKRRDQVSL